MINCRDKNGETPLMRAAIHNHKEVIERIIETSTDAVNVRDDKQQNILHKACIHDLRSLIYALAKWNQELCVKMLDEQDFNGRTPLHLAVRKNNFQLVKTLCMMGANLSIPDKNGNTCLHEAIKCNYEKIGNFLKQNGSKTNIKNNEGKTPKTLAKKTSFLKF